jgi:hypothetical protein
MSRHSSAQSKERNHCNLAGLSAAFQHRARAPHQHDGPLPSGRHNRGASEAPHHRTPAYSQTSQRCSSHLTGEMAHDVLPLQLDPDPAVHLRTSTHAAHNTQPRQPRTQVLHTSHGYSKHIQAVSCSGRKGRASPEAVCVESDGRLEEVVHAVDVEHGHARGLGALHKDHGAQRTEAGR